MRGSHFSFDTFTLFCLSVHSDTFHQLIIFLLFPAQRPVPGIFQHHGGHHQQQHRRNESPRTAHHQIHGHNSETALPHDTNRHIEHIPLEMAVARHLRIACYCLGRHRFPPPPRTYPDIEVHQCLLVSRRCRVRTHDTTHQRNAEQHGEKIKYQRIGYRELHHNGSHHTRCPSEKSPSPY